VSAGAPSLRARAQRVTREVELYAPVKAFLEARGYAVKGEIAGCDLVAVRAAEPPIIVELKLTFTLGLLLQGVDRLSITDAVYLAIPARAARRRGIRPLCRRLGLGLLAVHGPRPRVEVLVDPGPYSPPHDRRRTARMLGEHTRRRGDPTPGGASRTPIMTAYRQEALRLADALRDGPATVAALRVAAESPRAQQILARDVYGWFERVSRGTYRLRDEGLAVLGVFAGEDP